MQGVGPREAALGLGFALVAAGLGLAVLNLAFYPGQCPPSGTRVIVEGDGSGSCAAQSFLDLAWTMAQVGGLLVAGGVLALWGGWRRNAWLVAAAVLPTLLLVFRFGIGVLGPLGLLFAALLVGVAAWGASRWRRAPAAGPP